MSYPKTFPTVLYQVLSDESNVDSITWLPHGRAFCILNRNKLVEQVLPRYFDGDIIKFASFSRKLKRWGFVRVPSNECDSAFYNKHFRREHPSLDQMRPDSKATFPVEFALPPCGYKSTTMSPKVAANALKSVVEHRPLKKRPVDESSLKLSARTSTTSLPEPKLIRVVKSFPPTTILATCSYDDIERQGRLNRNKLKCPTPQQQTSNHTRELLLQKLLKRQLLREERKAKQHFHQHYIPNNAARQSLLQRLQQELYQQAQHRSVSPSQRHPNLVRDLLHACNSSSVSSSMVLSNEQPLYSRKNPSDPPHYHLFQKRGRSGATGRVVYDYAHAA